MAKKSIHLPQELIIEILLILPVKTLLQCKCVCKSWLSLICNPNFATSHFQLAASPTNRLVCLGKYSETLSIDFNASLNNDSSYASLSLDFLRLQSHYRIGGSCRGFLFLYNYNDLYLWNPSTGIHKQIPAPPIPIADKFLHALSGFAYDHSTDDYLIVLGIYDMVSYSFDFMVFSLRANKWKQVEVDSHLPRMTLTHYEDIPRVGLLLNDSIHWMVYNYETRMDVIIAFDLTERRISEIALPYGLCATHFSYDYDLLVIEGLIGAWIVDMHTVEIWVMKKYAVHSSWTKIIEFSVDPDLYDFLFILNFTNCGDIFGVDGAGGFVKFNDKGQSLEHHSSHKGLYTKRSQMAVFTESLLSLPCGTDQT